MPVSSAVSSPVTTPAAGRTSPGNATAHAPRLIAIPGPGERIWPAAAGPALATFRIAVDRAGRVRSSCRALHPDLAGSFPLTHDPLTDLRSLLHASIPAGRGWMGWFAYEFGRLLEPVSLRVARPGTLVELHRVGDDAPLALRRRPFRLRLDDPDHARPRFQRIVGRAIEYIRAGDVYQVNLSHAIRGSFAGCAASCFAALASEARPRFGAYLESPGRSRAILSLSPELFLHYDAATRTVTTQPMKGTRPSSADPRELLGSPKDAAELAMIVDLMRNDLSRVCDIGSVRVADARSVARHASGVLQATATVRGRLRDGRDPVDLLAAAFPAGSVTGAPRIRAMQVIERLERRRRGAYCGCIAWFDDSGDATLSVAIRTAEITGRPGATGFDEARFTYAAGAGIVADSRPESEWRETLDKARVVLALAGACGGSGNPRRVTRFRAGNGRRWHGS